MGNTVTLDDVGEQVNAREYPYGRQDNKAIGVVMAIVAPNGDHCAIFNSDTRYRETQAEAVRTFMENHQYTR